MLTKHDIETFVNQDLLSGEEIHYVSKIELPKLAIKQLAIGFIAVIITSTISAFVLENFVNLKDQNRMVIIGSICGAILFLYLLWALLFYKKSTRRIVSITNLRFLIYEYKSGLDKLKNVDELENYEYKREITFDAVESMKITEGENNTGLLAMIFDQENETKTGWETAKLHLEIDDCKALRVAIPDRMRPEGKKEDYWERTYND